MKRCRYALALCILTLAAVALLHGLLGCQQDSTTQPSTEDGRTYIFSDRKDARLEYIYVVHGSHMLCQVAQFPGFKDRRFFLNETVPPDVLQRVRDKSTQKTELKTMVPGGPWYSSVVLDGERIAEPILYKNENESVTELTADLRANAGKAIDFPPSWVANSPAICQQLGLRQEPRNAPIVNLHVEVTNEFESEPVGLRIWIDGQKKADGVYKARNLDTADFDFPLPPATHHVKVEIPGKVECSFDVSTTSNLWAEILFGHTLDEKPFCHVELVDRFRRKF